MEHDTDFEGRVYRIIRFRRNGRPRTLKNYVTLSIAQLHCNDPRTRGANWFDGYDYVRGYRKATKS